MMIADRFPTSPACLGILLASLLLFSEGAAVAQAPIPADPSASSTPSKTKKVADLTNRYRFWERYTTEEKEAGPGVVASFRVAVLEVTRDSVDSAQGAPKRTETTRQAIYSERPAELSGPGLVASTTRTIENFQVKPDNLAKTMSSRPLESVSVLVRPRLGELPTILCLTPGRTLTEYEFDVLSHEVDVPHLSTLLPSQVVRLGDTWRISRKAAQALLGDPYLQSDALVGKLAEIRKEEDGSRMIASIAISGKLVGPAGETTVNAEVLFTFPTDLATKPNVKKPIFPPRPMDDLVEARGAITELRLARVLSGPLPGPGRLRFQSNRELTLHRQLGVVAGAAVPPRVAKPPEPTEENSWLNHVDPSGRYSLRHPQDLLAPDRTQPPAEPNQTLLIRTRREGREMLQVDFVPRTLAPEDLKKELLDKYGALKMEVLKGEESWLPEAEWPGVRVLRIDAALKVGESKVAATGGAPRIHFDGYLIQFGQASSILAVATTSKDSVGPFRREVEQILKSIKLDPARPLAR